MRQTHGESRRMIAAGLVLSGLLVITGASSTATAQTPGVTIYEGARIIVGDGSAPIENGAFVVDGGRITQVGRSGQIKVPAGAARVNLTGKTVMPAIVDT